MGETIDLGNLFHTVTRDLVKNQVSSDSAQQQSSASQGGDLLGSLSGGQAPAVVCRMGNSNIPPNCLRTFWHVIAKPAFFAG